MPEHYPKILIIGETFRNDTGGGITLRNLFSNWPNNKLAVITQSDLNDEKICLNYYKIGANENRFIKILKFLFSVGKFKYFTSSNIILKNNDLGINFHIKILFLNLVKKTIGALSHFLGIHHMLHSNRLSNLLLSWINEFDPDVIYIQPNSLQIILLVDKLVLKVNKPIVIHIVDDYRKTKNKFGLLYYYFEKKIEHEVTQLVNRASLRFSICEEMSEEYLTRFGEVFIPIHNPVQIERWNKKKYKYDSIISNEFRIVYAGRIGVANRKAINQLIDLVLSLNKEKQLICFDIYSVDHDEIIINRLKDIKSIRHHGFIPHDSLPATLSNYDLLFLPLSTSSRSLNYTRLSMPTKASEYMATGIPIIVYAPKQTALYRYAEKYKWAFVASNLHELKKGVMLLLGSDSARNEFSEKAIELAIRKHELTYVSRVFQQKIKELI